MLIHDSMVDPMLPTPDTAFQLCIGQHSKEEQHLMSRPLHSGKLLSSQPCPQPKSFCRLDDVPTLVPSSTSSHSQDVETFFRGDKLYGDNFESDQLKQWFEDEKEAYANLLAKTGQ